MEPQTCSCLGLRSLHMSSLIRACLRQRCPNLKNQQSAPQRTFNVTKLNVSARPTRQWVGGSQPWLQLDFLPNRTCSYELLEWILTARVRLC